MLTEMGKQIAECCSNLCFLPILVVCGGSRSGCCNTLHQPGITLQYIPPGSLNKK